LTTLTLDQLQALERFDTPTISNVVEQCNVRDRSQGFVGAQIRCLFPQLGVRVGYAVTVLADSTTPRERPAMEKEWAIWQALEQSPKPVFLVIQNTGHRPSHACFLGEIMSNIALRLGAVAVLTDGGVRDIEQISGLGLQIYAAGLVASHGTFRIIDVNAPVRVDGVNIAPGDLLHGDANGVVTVPTEIVPQLIEKCGPFLERERAMIDYVKSRQFSVEGLREWYNLEKIH